MPIAVKTTRPRIEAQHQFDLLMQLYDKGTELDTNGRIDVIHKFLAISQPGVEQQIKWGWFSKEDRATRIVETLRWGLDQFRDGKPFTRVGPRQSLFYGDENVEFEDGVVWDRFRDRVTRLSSRDPRHLFLTRVFELLTEVAPWLRVCARAECRRFFLFQRPKQIYCGDACAQRVRMARFVAQRTPSASRRRKTRRVSR